MPRAKREEKYCAAPPTFEHEPCVTRALSIIADAGGAHPTVARVIRVEDAIDDPDVAPGRACPHYFERAATIIWHIPPHPMTESELAECSYYLPDGARPEKIERECEELRARERMKFMCAHGVSNTGKGDPQDKDTEPQLAPLAPPARDSIRRGRRAREPITARQYDIDERKRVRADAAMREGYNAWCAISCATIVNRVRWTWRREKNAHLLPRLNEHELFREFVDRAYAPQGDHELSDREIAFLMAYIHNAFHKGPRAILEPPGGDL